MLHGARYFFFLNLPFHQPLPHSITDNLMMNPNWERAVIGIVQQSRKIGKKKRSILISVRSVICFSSSGLECHTLDEARDKSSRSVGFLINKITPQNSVLSQTALRMDVDKRVHRAENIFRIYRIT